MSNVPTEPGPAMDAWLCEHVFKWQPVDLPTTGSFLLPSGEIVNPFHVPALSTTGDGMLLLWVAVYGARLTKDGPGVEAIVWRDYTTVGRTALWTDAPGALALAAAAAYQDTPP